MFLTYLCCYVARLGVGAVGGGGRLERGVSGSPGGLVELAALSGQGRVCCRETKSRSFALLTWVPQELARGGLCPTWVGEECRLCQVEPGVVGGSQVAAALLGQW